MSKAPIINNNCLSLSNWKRTKLEAYSKGSDQVHKNESGFEICFKIAGRLENLRWVYCEMV